MPVGFWGDDSGERYRGAYFDLYPGVWRQGDWVTITPEGAYVISGRSDATLNRAGVRLGTGELYALVEARDEISDSLVVHLPADGGAGELLMFVVPSDPSKATPETVRALRAAIKDELSPRHVPDTVFFVRAIPRTITGKKLEVPVKRLLQGESSDAVVSVGALADPQAWAEFIDLAATR